MSARRVGDLSFDDVIEMALRLPEVDLREWTNWTSIRVRGKGFAWLSEREGSFNLKALRDEQQALVAEQPEVFSESYTTGRFGWVTVRVDRVDPEEMRELVTEAWRLSAPVGLAREVGLG
jgi:hypothetical protein